ncbi:MAG: cytochrome c5 family protein [Burkholderiales bacterium]|jgi:cytochrome c5|nr:cytochrome c5 family protein [Burkholderiales bacterium]MBK9345935.1 cytochrome c5 family protein [Burkholderiales bacterium]
MQKKYVGLLLVCSALLAACGKPEATAPAAETTTTAPAVAAAAPEAENAVGKSIYGKTCALCHAAGVAGAPKPGDKADWGPRIAQGNDMLYKHAIEGFNGAKGSMPARGGNPALKDDEVKAAVDFMVAQSR